MSFQLTKSKGDMTMSERVEDYLQEAKFAFTNSQYDVALELCEKAINQDPDNAEAYTAAGRTCMVLDKLQEGETYFEKALSLDDKNGEKYFDLANIKFGLKKYNDALTYYALADQTGCADEIRQKIYYQVGMISYMTGNTKAALLNFQKAENIGTVNSDTKEIILKRLQIYVETSDLANAEKCALQLKMIAPEEFRSYQIYFQVLVALGKYEYAQKLMDEAEQYADVDTDIHNKADICLNRASLYIAKGDQQPENYAENYDAALDVFDQFLLTENLPVDVRAAISIAKAEIFLKRECFSEALHCVEDIGGDEETQEKIRFVQLTSYFGMEDFERAESLATQLKSSSNEYYVYFATYADAYIAQKLAQKDPTQLSSAENKYNTAIAFYKNKAFEKPQDIFAYIFRIRLYAENGKYARAEELARMLPDSLKVDLEKYIADCKMEG
jgi:tetratricopeptide (TPR) repeat protein